MWELHKIKVCPLCCAQKGQEIERKADSCWVPLFCCFPCLKETLNPIGERGGGLERVIANSGYYVYLGDTRTTSLEQDPMKGKT